MFFFFGVFKENFMVLLVIVEVVNCIFFMVNVFLDLKFIVLMMVFVFMLVNWVFLEVKNVIW